MAGKEMIQLIFLVLILLSTRFKTQEALDPEKTASQLFQVAGFLDSNQQNILASAEHF